MGKWDPKALKAFQELQPKSGPRAWAWGHGRTKARVQPVEKVQPLANNSKGIRIIS